MYKRQALDRRISREFNALILRLLQKDRELRFPSVPDGAELLPYNQAVAFAPKGGSVWMLLVCHSGAPNCVLPGGALRALAGFNFPAGTLIGQTGVSYDTSNIAFPW